MFDLLFTGDTFLMTKDNSSPFKDEILSLFESSKYCCLNLETTVGCGNNKVAKAYTFQVPPESLSFINDNCVLSVANNHSLDYNITGFSETIDNLERRNINYIGAEKNNVFICEIGNEKCCISSYYGNSDCIAKLNVERIVSEVKEHKKYFKYIFVCLHWGEEYSTFPRPSQQETAHRIIDAGANVVIGHHPHVPQGYERYKDGLIFYSLGNFNFNVAHPYHNRLDTTKIAYCVSINMDNQIQYKIIPIHIDDCYRPELFKDPQSTKRFCLYLDSISNPLRGKIGWLYYYANVSNHFFYNHMPSWKKRIKKYGNSERKKMIKWLFSIATIPYCVGLLLSPFYKKITY